jgi:uncharacterized phage infection (PIP) family protein YhgE
LFVNVPDVTVQQAGLQTIDIGHVTTVQQVPPQINDKLNQLQQLASQIKSEVGQLGLPKQP